MFIKFFQTSALNHPKRFGTILALIGVLVLTPDTMIMRLSTLERWPLMGWRGILMGATLLLLCRYLLPQNLNEECIINSDDEDENDNSKNSELESYDIIDMIDKNDINEVNKRNIYINRCAYNI